MNKVFLSCCMLFLCFGMVSAQPMKSGLTPTDGKGPEVKATGREYSIIVYERKSNDPMPLDRELSSGRAGAFWQGIYDVYRSTFAGKVIGLSSNILDTGIDLLVKAFTKNKENRLNWESTIRREMTYTKKLPMQTEISDFYRNPSSKGAMDPRDMMFDGFGCRQYLTYRDNDNTLKRILVFEIACSLDDSALGKQRIMHHGKFDVKVDSIRFNPYLCDLPNDSLTEDQVNDALRIPLDFQKRKNLTFRLNANIMSSWMTEAIEIFKDQQLGQFQVEFTIPDSTVLDSIGKWKGYYTYNSNYSADQENPKKNVRVSGECFIVPRSYIGLYNDSTSSLAPLWGTGQYRIDMQITESCQINDSYYKIITQNDKQKKMDEKWNNKWKEEWSIIKKRKKNRTFFHEFWDQVKQEFDVNDHKWVCTILDPVKNAVLIDEEKWVKQIINVDDITQSAKTSKTSTGQPVGNKGTSAAGSMNMNDNGGQMPKGDMEPRP